MYGESEDPELTELFDGCEDVTQEAMANDAKYMDGNTLDDIISEARLSAGAYYGPVPCETSRAIIMEMVNSPLTPFGQYHKRRLSDEEIAEHIAQANAQTDATD